ncbi:MAG: hypothetical protein ACREL7_12870 [Longimicrobiales bacterium]
MRVVLFVVASLLAFVNLRACPLAAQARGPVDLDTTFALRGTDVSSPAQRTGSLPGRLLSALGGAALGAGVGFFASQVVRGDWDEPGGANMDRSAWAAIGGSIGLAVGFSFPLGPGGPPEEQRDLRSDRDVLLAREWEGTGVNTAWDAVRLRRPEWLNERGVHILGESSEETIVVILDEVRLGGVGTLREVSAYIIQSIEFVDPGPATVRWGAGHDHGVILINSKGGAPRDPAAAGYR